MSNRAALDRNTMNPMSTGNAVFSLGRRGWEPALSAILKVLFGGAPFYSILSINCAAPTVLAGNFGYQKLVPDLPSVKTLSREKAHVTVHDSIQQFSVFSVKTLYLRNWWFFIKSDLSFLYLTCYDKIKAFAAKKFLTLLLTNLQTVIYIKEYKYNTG